MPFTPFHFGPGAIVYAMAPCRISFLAFCGANVLMDIEPLYFMLSGQDPWHRFFHTYVGAAPIAIATLALFMLALRLASRVTLPNPLGWQDLTLFPVLAGAVAGSYSHIVLDSVMHADIRLLSPLSQANGLYNFIPIDMLHVWCLACAAAALVIMGIRWLFRDKNTDN